MATYLKSLTRRASLTEGSVRTAKSYKAKVASLTFEKAGLRAQAQSLTEELVKHRSDLKHTSTARAQAEDKERKAQEGLRVAEGELWLVKEELQAAKGVKTTTLDQVHQEAFEVGNSVERLTKECSMLRGDLERQKALVS